MQEAIPSDNPAVAEIDHRPSFARVLVMTLAGLLLALGLALVAGLLWQGISSTRESASRQMSTVLTRSAERLQLLTTAAEMTATSVQRAALTFPVGPTTLRPTLENALAAFEQRPQLSYVGIVLPGTGEYGKLERTDDGKVLLRLFPGDRLTDLVTRSYVLGRHGFVLQTETPNDGYDPRTRPFYQAGLSAPAGGAWIPVYQRIVNTDPDKALWGLSFMQTVRDDEGRLIGVLDTYMDLPALNRFVHSIEIEYNAHVQIIELGQAPDHVPKLIGAATLNRAPRAVPPELGPLVKAGTDFTGRMQLNGEAVWVAAHRLDLRGGVSWLVVASRPSSIVTKPMQRLLYQVLGAELVLAVLLILASTRMAKHLSQPLAELEQRAARIERDGTETLLDEPHGTIGQFRETGRLGLAFDRMAAAMHQRRRELLILNAELEQRVAHRTRELQSLNKELETFCYSVSHDLRAPLRGISGFTEIIARDHANALDDTARGYLNRVLVATRRMGDLIDDLLNLSRVSRDEMHRSNVDVSALARTVFAELQHAAPERRVEIHVQDGLTADADPRLLRVALENLLGNAWKFTSRAAAPRIDFTASDEGGEPGFAVSDNGAGFDMRYAGKLFGPFQRLHRMDEFPGTGIGLATVQRIVARHGGRVSAWGEPGKGATFWFTLEPST